MSILDRFRFIGSSPRAGLLALAVGVGATLIWVQILGGTSTILNLWPTEAPPSTSRSTPPQASS